MVHDIVRDHLPLEDVRVEWQPLLQLVPAVTIIWYHRGRLSSVWVRIDGGGRALTVYDLTRLRGNRGTWGRFTVVERDNRSAVLLRPGVLLDHPRRIKGMRVDDRHEDAAGLHRFLERLIRDRSRVTTI